MAAHAAHFYEVRFHLHTPLFCNTLKLSASFVDSMYRVSSQYSVEEYLIDHRYCLWHNLKIHATWPHTAKSYICGEWVHVVYAETVTCILSEDIWWIYPLSHRYIIEVWSIYMYTKLSAMQFFSLMLQVSSLNGTYYMFILNEEEAASLPRDVPLENKTRSLIMEESVSDYREGRDTIKN